MILLDGRPLQSASEVRGIGTYARELIHALRETSVGNDLRLLLARDGPEPAEARQLRSSPARLQLATLHPTLQPLADPILVGLALRRYRPALYHALEWGQPAWASCPVVVTVHDLIPFLFPRDYPWVRRARLPALHLLRFASLVITPSQATAGDVQRMAHVPADRVRVVPEGVDGGFVPAPAARVAATLRTLGISGPYVLTVGTFDPRKRMSLLAEAFARVRARRDVSLVIAGDQGTFAPAVRSALAATGVAQHTVVTGLVPQEALVDLYSGTACFVLTSAFEGFGLPPLEAMACGAPVVMFHNSALPEVAGPATLVTPDGDPKALAEAISDVLDDDASPARTREAGIAWAQRFTWARAAERTVSVYREVLGSAQSRAREAGDMAS